MNRVSIQPYVVSPTENRKQVSRFATSQQYATIDPENEAYHPRSSPEKQNKYLWAHVFTQCAQTLLNQHGSDSHGGLANATRPEISAVQSYEAIQVQETVPNSFEPPQRRAFQACVFCAMLHWSETLHREYIAGDRCSIPSPGEVAKCLSAEWYSKAWPDIPREEIMASAVDFPHLDDDGLAMTSTKVLMHKRRVPDAALQGDVPVCVCRDCRAG